MNSRVVSVGACSFGSGEFHLIAGPCSIESQSQFSRLGAAVKALGATLVRGGMHKLRTNPRAFQGLGTEAYPIAQQVKRELGLPFVSEITDPRQLEPLEGLVDLFQVGSRNMHNYALLKELGKTRTPVLLKRGLAALVDEWILAAEYIEQAGNPNIILCERGIRTFERVTRNTLDLSAVAYVKEKTPYPVVVDPSHATGRPDLIGRMALAAAACGADGLIIEVHDQPSLALSDGDQAMTPEALAALIPTLDRVLSAVSMVWAPRLTPEWRRGSALAEERARMSSFVGH